MYKIHVQWLHDLMKYFILSATAAIITDISVFSISIATIVKETKSFNIIIQLNNPTL